MEEEGSINFKALRAKFQEEGLLAHSKNSRPAVAEKPKLLQPFLGHCSSAVCGVATAVENQTPEIPRVVFRDGLQSPGGKRPISFPPHSKQTSLSSQLANGDGSAKHPLKDWPLVLPVPPVKDHKVDAPTGKEEKLEAETRKEVFSHTKIKKKGLLLPFKSAKASKNVADNGEELTYSDLPSRPGTSPGYFSSMNKQGTEERASLQSDQSASEYAVSSPEFVVSPASPERCPDSNRILSTLEKAKRKLSRRQFAVLPKPKGLRSLDYSCTDKTFPLSPKNPDRLGTDVLVPPPSSLPHLACISARPFCKANNSACKPTFDKHLILEKARQLQVRTSEPYPPRSPLKKPLPELWTLGPVPVKPPRPSTVDLSSYNAGLTKGKETLPGWCKTPKKEAASVLDAPDFPDFEISELEAAEDEPVDIAALEMEALDIVVGNPETPAVLEANYYGGSDSASAVCEPREPNRVHVVQDLNLGTSHIIPLDPARFPGPINLLEFPELPLAERRYYCEDAAVDSFLNSRSDDTDVGATEKLSVPEETEFLGQATPNQKTPTPPRDHQSCYYETCDNVYEDVEINRQLSSPMLTKQKSRLRNPYADSQLRKGEACLHKRPRHPWQYTKPYAAEHKEQRKREKQRLEKERKEQKERKKENEMKKKFKVTGEEEPMYHAKVMVASKVRKNDLPVRNGDTVSIIRTTNCPKGKWLARDANHKYGYISVMNVELNIKDMLELGKKAQAAGRGAYVEPDTFSIGSRSFTDDSEEWACEDETLSPSYESHVAQQTISEPEMSHLDAQHTISDSNLEDQHTQTRHEALQKLALLVQQSKEGDGGATPTNADTSSFLCAVEEPPYPEQEIDFTEMELLPPPPPYADTL